MAVFSQISRLGLARPFTRLHQNHQRLGLFGCRSVTTETPNEKEKSQNAPSFADVPCLGLALPFTRLYRNHQRHGLLECRKVSTRIPNEVEKRNVQGFAGAPRLGLLLPFTGLRHDHKRLELPGCRAVSTETLKEEENDNEPGFAGHFLRGVGQVVFCNSPKSGLAILGGLAIGDPYLAALASAGTISATGAARVAGLDKGALGNGLWGYNGCLVGCASAVFISPLPEVVQSPLLLGSVTTGLAAAIIGGAASPFVSAALKPAMGTVPQWTFAFNFVTLSVLLRTRPLAGTPSSIPSFLFDPLLAIHAPLRGVSQIFVVESSLAGAALLGGIGLYSPGLAAHAFLGSTIGAATGVGLGAELAEVSIGLWGFNSALTSVGVGVFFCHSPQAVALSAGGAAMTAAVFGALKSVFGGWDAPCLTLPFCITMSGCYLLKGAIPGLQLASNPHSPEENTAKKTA